MVEKLEPPELKPCPFRAGKANLDHENNLAYVFCGGCGTISPICMSDDDAIAAWNRRDPNAITLDPADEGFVERVERAMPDIHKLITIYEDEEKRAETDDPGCRLAGNPARWPAVRAMNAVRNAIIAVIAEIMKRRGG